jgi:hypothetical protein
MNYVWILWSITLFLCGEYLVFLEWESPLSLRFSSWLLQSFSVICNLCFVWALESGKRNERQTLLL